jgi:hypothetical protein
MLITLTALLLMAGPSAVAAGRPAKVCNDLRIDLVQVSFEGPGGHVERGPVRPGACVELPRLKTGRYSLRFIERGEHESAICTRQVWVCDDAVIRITPQDGARCMQ